MNKEGLWIYFKDFDNKDYGPVPLKSIDDIQEMIEGHRGYHYKYIVINKSKNGDEVITSGIIESYSRKKKLWKK